MKFSIVLTLFVALSIAKNVVDARCEKARGLISTCEFNPANIRCQSDDDCNGGECCSYGCGGRTDCFDKEQQTSRPEFCNLPKVTGLCRAYFPRWYFNSQLGQCSRFIYGGCAGNQNNFRTRAECEQTCQ